MPRRNSLSTRPADQPPSPHFSPRYAHNDTGRTDSMTEHLYRKFSVLRGTKRKGREKRENGTQKGEGKKNPCVCMYVRARCARATRVKRSSFQRRAYIDRQDNPPSSSSLPLLSLRAPHARRFLCIDMRLNFSRSSRDIFLERGIFVDDTLSPPPLPFHAPETTRILGPLTRSR